MKSLLLALTVLTCYNLHAEEIEIEVPYHIVSDSTDASLNGKVRISGKVFESYTNQSIDSLSIYLDDSLCLVTTESEFSLEFDSGAVHQMVFASPNHYSVSTQFFDFTANKSIDIEVYLQSTESNGILDVVEKPVIYLYAKESTEVNIELITNGKLLFSYPEYQDGWNVTCNSNGKIIKDEKSYDYLFWDGSMSNLEQYVDKQYGYIIQGSNAVSFLEHTLTNIGLNQSEQNDFITYWAPRMVGKEHVFVHFILDKDYDNIAQINVTPEPDSQLRLFMVFEDYSNQNWDEIGPIPQNFETFNRKGLTLVEWGGAELKTVNQP